MSQSEAQPSKICARCGRDFSWRARSARHWEEVRYCSERCRRKRVGSTDRQLEQAILHLLQKQPRGASICPSEATRLVRSEDWRDWLESTREAARRLHAAGQLDILQKGRPVNPSLAKGPIRLRLRSSDAGSAAAIAASPGDTPDSNDQAS